PFAVGTNVAGPSESLNHVEVDVDTTHQGSSFVTWDTEIDWMQISFTAAPPVLLVHGIFSSAETWYPLWFEQLTAAHVPFHPITIPGFGTQSIKFESAVIAGAVQTLKLAYGADKSNIVAHSRGGIDSRDYVEPIEVNDVDKLIMIGTPNAGLRWADYAHNLTSSFPGLQKLLDKFLPISYILTTSYMQNYDATHGF